MNLIPPHGSLLFLFKNMVLHFTKKTFVMPFVSITVGRLVYFGHSFTAVNCPCGVFPSIHHNITWYIFEVCYAVGTKPCLQSLSGEQLKYKTANDTDEARLDMVAENFWSKKKAFFDIKVCNALIHYLLIVIAT